MKDLCLDRYIQCGCRFIRNQQFRTAGKGDCNNNSLLHSTGKLMRIFNRTFSRNSNKLQHIFRFLPGFFTIHLFMTKQTLCNLLSHGKYRVQRSHRILENHRYECSPDMLQFGFIHPKNIFPADLHFIAFHNSRRRIDQS